MESINKIELQGRVGSVAIANVGDTKMTRFSLATEYCYRDKDGNAVIEVTWHNCLAFEGDGRNVDAVAKGAAVHLTGRLRVLRATGGNGEPRAVTEVVVGKLEAVPEER